MSLSIVLPCYNPIAGWLESVLTNFTELSKNNPDAELIIVNDGSINLLNEEVIASIKNFPRISFKYYNINKTCFVVNFIFAYPICIPLVGCDIIVRYRAYRGRK